MNKRWTAFLLAAALFTLAGCGRTASAPSDAADLLNKAEQAMEKLSSVHTTVAYDESSVTSEPAKRKSFVVQLQSDTELTNGKALETVMVKVPELPARHIQIAQNGSKLAMAEETEEGSGAWQALTEDERKQLLGAGVPFTAPTASLALLEPFIGNAEMEKIDYGYALQFSLSPAEYREFISLFAKNSAAPESFLHSHSGFPVIDKMDIELKVDDSTFYVTSFKLSAQVTNYFGRDYIRHKQKFDAAYSYFNDIDPVAIPEKAAL